LDKRALISASAALATAIISGFILYETVIANNILGKIGLLGLFLASMFSHLTVIGRGIFVPTFLALTGVYPALVLGFVAGWGGALGEITTYYWGLGIRGAIAEDEDNEISRWINRYGLIAILILAATPLPDTPIVLLAGSNRFPLYKILLIEAFGKIVLYSFGAIFGGLVFTGLTDMIGNLLTSLLIVVASVIFCVVISWEKSRNKLLELKKRLLS
jgi:membrane protein YqaA with SNARE-associated domain